MASPSSSSCLSCWCASATLTRLGRRRSNLQRGRYRPAQQIIASECVLSHCGQRANVTRIDFECVSNTRESPASRPARYSSGHRFELGDRVLLLHVVGCHRILLLEGLGQIARLGVPSYVRSGPRSMYIMRRLRCAPIRPGIGVRICRANPNRIGTVVLPGILRARPDQTGPFRSVGPRIRSCLPADAVGIPPSHLTTIPWSKHAMISTRISPDSYAERLACGSEWHAINTLMNEHYFGNPAPNL